MGSLVSTSAAKAVTTAGLTSIHDLKISDAATTAQVGLHIGKNEQVTKKDTETEKKVEEIGKKRGI